MRKMVIFTLVITALVLGFSYSTKSAKQIDYPQCTGNTGQECRFEDILYVNTGKHLLNDLDLIALKTAASNTDTSMLLDTDLADNFNTVAVVYAQIWVEDGKFEQFWQEYNLLKDENLIQEKKTADCSKIKSKLPIVEERFAKLKDNEHMYPNPTTLYYESYALGCEIE